MLNRLLGILGWLGTALVFAALAVRLAGSIMVIDPSWDPYVYWTTVAGFVCLVLYLAGHWRELARTFDRRQARLGALAATSVVAVLGILVMINYLAVRQNKRWDLTENQIFSLSDQTLRILRGLDMPIRILLFAQEPEFPGYRDQLDGYANASNLVTLDYIDADKQPAIAKQYEVQSYGTIVFEYDGRTERVTSSTEQDLTNALIKVLAGEEHVAYFTTGHGEHDPTNSDPRVGYSGIAAALERDNYRVNALVLAQERDVPDDATVVVVAGPTTDFFAPEIEALRRYIDKGGKVLFMIDPPAQADSQPLTGLIGLVQEWGVQLGNNVVVDVSGMGQLLGTDESVPVVATYPPHAITQGFSFVTAYPMARSVTPAPSTDGSGPVVTSILQTSARSWAEANLSELLGSGQVQLDLEAGDQQGPISLGVAVSAPLPEPAAQANGDNGDTTADATEASTPEIRLAVFGDSDFIANSTGNVRGNADLFLNTVNWLAQQENLIAIRPRLPEDRRLTMTAAQQRIVFWLALFILPGAIVGSGIYSWWQRR
jgi:ABC-type uncharacterized transport system involved in gliding motility auxiliary subunit